MISTEPWELAAALAVLEQAQQEAAALRDMIGDEQALDAAERRCGSARRLVERIRATLDNDLSSQCHAQPALRQGAVHG
jgi:hypothetical protein